MNVKRFIAASLLVFLAFELIDTIVHMGILAKTYQSMAYLWRPDMMSKMWIMHAGSLILSFLFTYIFIRGYENKGIAEGFRYGIIIGLFSNIPYGFYSYVMYPLPVWLCLQWFIYGMAEFIICGMIAAAVYKPNKK